MLAANCRQEVRCTAAYSSGGSTSGRISSGGTSTFGTKGSTARTTPSSVISTGGGSRSRSPTGTVTAPREQHEQQGQLVHECCAPVGR